jgi:Na+-transporting NADH:ubiquinone oxidoreductase subunit NqrE
MVTTSIASLFENKVIASSVLLRFLKDKMFLVTSAPSIRFVLESVLNRVASSSYLHTGVYFLGIKTCKHHIYNNDSIGLSSFIVETFFSRSF